MTYELISTRDRLPPYRQEVLYWHPAGRGSWCIGVLYKGNDQYGDYFMASGGGWYLRDSHTKWATLPPKQRARK